MASISDVISNSNGVNNSQSGALSSSSASSNALGNEQTFLTLLVAQLKNQDPMQPQDGTQFVTQLAQFTNLEQNLAMRSDLDALKTKYAPSSTDSSSSSNPTTQS
jgi:flagellar basal-body rod modification protein FlgD